MEKYKGHDLPRYLSSWELKLFRWCDMNPNVLEWGSESIVIPYESPIDRKVHRYIVDAVVKLKTATGIKKYLIEVKPYKQTQKPTQKRQTKRFIQEAMTYAVNQEKWRAADLFCKEHGWQFKIITEKELGL